MAQHWAFKTADDIIAKYGNKAITCASGISPSGVVHAGNLREIMTTDAVYRALKAKGAEAKFIFSWDDFDRFRKVPVGVPESFKEHIGKPYCDIPDPWGEFQSYAQRYQTQFETAAKKLGIEPKFIRQHEMYRAGTYADQIRFTLEKRAQIAEILARNMTQGMTAEQKEAYFPVSVYSRFTGKDTTKVVNFDDDKLEYICTETGKRDIIEISKDHIVKLPWKIDWPMRWKFEQVDFEPGGPDHASPQSSYDVGSQISKEIFGREPPHFICYQFIRIKGMNEKMSSSKGNVFSPADLLAIYPAEVVRWLYCRASPDSVVDLAFDIDVIRVYDEFDKRAAQAKNSIDELAQQEIQLSLPFADSKAGSKAIPFRQVTGMGDATDFNKKRILELLGKSGFDEESIEERLDKGQSWMDKYCPEARSRLIDTPNSAYFAQLNAERQDRIRIFSTVVETAECKSLDDLENDLYAIPKKPGMSEDEKKKAQREFFKDVYMLLFGKEKGPRLPTFLWAVSKDKLRPLLNV